MGKKIKPPEKIVEINDLMGWYGGYYARWYKSGCPHPIPVEIIDVLSEINECLTNYLTNYKEKING